MSSGLFEEALDVVVLDVDNEDISPIEIYSALSRIAVARKNKRFNLVFLTKLDHVKFYERYRDIILSNISLTLSIKSVRVESCEDALKNLGTLITGVKIPIIVASEKCADLLKGLYNAEVEVV
ncbi:hypothetical protein TCELL_0858 [Thermogladius calderae 1633]|uniref:Uncharacterized protein n=1 Tax=Thermogladius calderae (strain DSM 22663 / VKM B-2946 / 1633) TaxID=1184251 RepID=I3TEU4_THEC1|nr:hypothetical protein [Thermogladius calderae]AFK51282.1 hypothetical protein TCELL_0858 [Thermogladius calderae 1633]